MYTLDFTVLHFTLAGHTNISWFLKLTLKTMQSFTVLCHVWLPSYAFCCVIALSWSLESDSSSPYIRVHWCMRNWQFRDQIPQSRFQESVCGIEKHAFKQMTSLLCVYISHTRRKLSARNRSSSSLLSGAGWMCYCKVCMGICVC